MKPRLAVLVAAACFISGPVSASFLEASSPAKVEYDRTMKTANADHRAAVKKCNTLPKPERKPCVKRQDEALAQVTRDAKARRMTPPAPPPKGTTT